MFVCAARCAVVRCSAARGKRDSIRTANVQSFPMSCLSPSLLSLSLSDFVICLEIDAWVGFLISIFLPSLHSVHIAVGEEERGFEICIVFGLLQT